MFAPFGFRLSGHAIANHVPGMRRLRTLVRNLMHEGHVMAIYSCNLRSIGRTTHAEGTAGAHLRYIGRERAASEILATHMPPDPQSARTWMDAHERQARKNARLCDKLRLALPRELDESQRSALVREFMDGLTGGNRVPWYAAIHQTGKDAHNPHAHIVVVDRDIETGKRVLALSDSIRDREKKGLPGPSAVEWVRERWEHYANTALERAGHEARIDRRTLEAQGIERDPQIHVGPRAQHIDTQVQRPESRIVPDPTPRHPERVIDYPMIDAGRTRRERNAEIIDLNLERDARSPFFETRIWAQFEREQRAKDRPVLAQLTAAARQRTLEERRLRRHFAEQEAQLRARRDAEGRFTRDWLRQRHAPEVASLRSAHGAEREALTQKHRGIWKRFVAAVDVTGRTRTRREEERAALQERQRQEREALAATIKAARASQAHAVQARYKAEKDEIATGRKQRLGLLHDRHETMRRREDALLQARATEREQAQRTVQGQIETWKSAQKQRDTSEAEKVTAEARVPRSKARQDWSAQDAPGETPAPSRAEKARSLKEKWKRDAERRAPGRDRGHEREPD